jgi:hypothetical protein
MSISSYRSDYNETTQVLIVGGGVVISVRERRGLVHIHARSCSALLDYRHLSR